MRTTFGVLAVAVVIASPLTAQRSWQTEIGIQGGYTRIATPGTAEPTDIIGLPAFNVGPALPVPAALFVILPWKDKIALEFDVAGAQLTGAIPATVFQAGVRADYAIASQLYAAGGGAVGYVNSGASGITETQLALQAAVGYRRPLSNRFNGRVEARVMFWGKTQNVEARNVYSLLLGLSTRTGAARRATAATRRGNRAWAPQLGLAAGYANLHAVGDPNDLTVLTFPNFGGGLGALGIAPGGPPTVFAILPIGTKIALEPGMDLHRFQSSGSTNFLANLSARLNYAVHGGWYAALGGNLTYSQSTGADAATITGLHTAVGYRFHLSGPVSARVEFNYTMFGKNEDVGTPPINITGLMFGAMVPLR